MAAEDSWRPGRGLAGRYEVRRRLGEGGMGVVYEVVDRHSDELIALKTLRRGIADAHAIKREFRTLADVTHPNVVQLYDLFDDGGTLCLTMELVPGCDLSTELRGQDLAEHTATAVAMPPGSREDTLRHAARGIGDFHPPPDLERVRDRFAQLARGLGALHRRGIVHRDIKPHNVRVTPDGRVVLLDFGLATSSGESGRLAGTIAYMAPEQAAEDVPVRPAADWYSFGVLLHEVITGRPPWSGAAIDVLRKKRVEEPASLRGIAGVPDDLAALVADLVRCDPDSRIAGDAVLERLGRRRRPRSGTAPHDITYQLIGRVGELGQLAAVWQSVRAGDPAWIAITGASGVGKTSLLRAFERGVDGITLRGRCYEREAIAYKGIDQIIDGAIERLAASEIACPEAADLVHAFPAVRQLVPPGTDLAADARIGHDRRGAALRALIARLAAEAPVAIALDDIHWADRDCLALLEYAFAPPGIRGVMFVAGARPDARARWNELPMPFVRIALGPLDERDAIELAQALLGRAALSVDAARLAREAAGHPLELVERVRASLSDRVVVPPAGIRDLLVVRVANAPPEVRLVVELVAIAGTPIPLAALARATGLAAEDLRAAVDRAQLAGLVKSQRASGRVVVEPAHDHVREVLFAALTPLERSERAAALAPALEDAGHQAAHVAELYVLACQPEAARRCAERAAVRMAELGGHDAAAALWRRASELCDGPARATLRRNTADALALAGRGSEAAELYLALARAGTHPGERMRDLRRGAEELLRAGRFTEGLAVVEQSVQGWREPKSPTVALARGLALHALTRAGRLPRGTLRPTQEAIEAVDLRWAATTGYTLGSPGQFCLGVEQYLRAALALGDPERVALGWTAEATLATFMGSQRFADACLDRAAAALADTDAPRARAVAIATAALVRMNEGAWARAEALVAEALDLADRRAPNMVWERNTAAMTTVMARFFRGDLAGLAREVRRDRERIAARGDLYAHELVHTGFTVLADLVADDPARASASLDQLDTRPTGVFTAWLRVIGHALVAAYGHRVDLHRERVERLLAGPLATPFVRSALVRGTLLWARAMLAVATGTDAARPIAALRAIRTRGIRGLGDLLAGHAAYRAGDRAAARRFGAAAELALLGDDMPMFAASARWLVDPSSWPSWRDALAKSGAVRPEAVARLLGPGLLIL